MRIAYVAAGAGGMFCGSCMRDNALARELTQLGHPTTLVPTYTPLRTDDQDSSIPRVFYGGISVFLAEKWSWMRRPLPLLDRALSWGPLLKLAARLGVSTRPEVLGELTVSVLRGESGRQRKALDELCSFLESDVRPDLVHLTNSLFAGLAPALRRRLGVPVFASVQGEDLFLDGLPERYRAEAVALIGEASASLDGIVASSHFAAERMATFLGVPRDRFRGIPAGVRFESIPAPGPASWASTASGAARSPMVGYLARIAPEKGLLDLAQAFRLLCERPEFSKNPPRLLAAGYLSPAERPYLEKVRSLLRDAGLESRFEYRGEVDRAGKFALLREVDVLSVPAPYPEAMGLYAYESLAVGTPVVLPRLGAFSEIVEETGGGLLVESGSPVALADGLARVLSDPVLRGELGARGETSVRERFTTEAMARATLAYYEESAAVFLSAARKG